MRHVSVISTCLLLVSNLHQEWPFEAPASFLTILVETAWECLHVLPAPPRSPPSWRLRPLPRSPPPRLRPRPLSPRRCLLGGRGTRRCRLPRPPRPARTSRRGIAASPAPPPRQRLKKMTLHVSYAIPLKPKFSQYAGALCQAGHHLCGWNEYKYYQYVVK